MQTNPPYPPTGVAQPYGLTHLAGRRAEQRRCDFCQCRAVRPAAAARGEPLPPSPLAVWQPGHWSWSGGQYVGIAGQYVQRPTPTANWVPGYWQQGPNGWIWTEGRWA
jgi:hypothetical protein